MKTMECPECGDVQEGETEQGLKKSLRAHILGSKEHQYNKQEFNQLFEDKKRENTEPQESEQEETEPDQVEETSEESDDEFDLESVSSMEETDLDTLVNEVEEGEDHKGETEKTPRKGLDDAINKGWGRLLTADLDPEDEEVSNMRKNLQGLAEDVGLGENAKHYYDEHLSGDSDDPRTALLGSLVLAGMLSLSLRPELGKKLVDKAQEQTGGDE